MLRSGECLMASIEMDEDGLRGTALWGVFDRNGQEIYSPQPMPHTVSALEGFRLRGFPPSPGGGRGGDPARPRFEGRR